MTSLKFSKASKLYLLNLMASVLTQVLVNSQLNCSIKLSEFDHYSIANRRGYPAAHGLPLARNGI